MKRMEMEVKDDKIKNPKTGRWCKIGGTVFKKLVREHVINEGDMTYDNEVIYEGKDAKEVVKKLKNIPLPPNKILYARNGVIKTRSCRVSKELIKERSRELGERVYRENPDEFVGLNTSQIQQKILDLIGLEMVKANSKIKSDFEYIIDNVDENDEYSDGDEIHEDGEEIKDEIKEEEDVFTSDYTTDDESDDGNLD